jgi:hypothetical protein
VDAYRASNSRVRGALWKALCVQDGVQDEITWIVDTPDPLIFVGPIRLVLLLGIFRRAPLFFFIRQNDAGHHFSY